MKNKSIFHGILEFGPSEGVHIRAKAEGASWGIYELNDNTYIRRGCCAKIKGDTPLKIWERFTSQHSI